MLKISKGFSLVELMLVMVIGMLISLSMLQVFIGSSKQRNEVTRYGEQIENGRLAMMYISQDMAVAGMWGALEVSQVASPTAVPDPCSTALVDLKANLPIHVQGYDSYTTGLTCIADVKSGTDVVVIRRAGTCPVGSTGCASMVTTGNVPPYFQASLCSPPVVGGNVADGNELSGPVSGWFAVSTSASDLTLHDKRCNSSYLAEIRPYVVHIYFVSNNTESGDGIPALKLAELTSSGFATTTIASGVEQLQIEYGTDANNDGIPDTYTSSPPSAATAADQVAFWRNTVATKIHLLARSTSPSSGYQNNTTYVLGNKLDGSNATVENSFTYGDAYRRHAFSDVVKLVTPASMRSGS